MNHVPIARLGSALILSAFASAQQSDVAAESEKRSSLQNAATTTLQACAPQT
jgi:hypothetical protein